MMAMIKAREASADVQRPSPAALAAMGSGRPEAHIDCWAKSGDATPFGARGPIEKGYRQ